MTTTTKLLVISGWLVALLVGGYLVIQQLRPPLDQSQEGVIFPQAEDDEAPIRVRNNSLDLVPGVRKNGKNHWEWRKQTHDGKQAFFHQGPFNENNETTLYVKVFLRIEDDPDATCKDGTPDGKAYLFKGDKVALQFGDNATADKFKAEMQRVIWRPTQSASYYRTIVSATGFSDPEFGVLSYDGAETDFITKISSGSAYCEFKAEPALRCAMVCRTSKQCADANRKMCRY